MVALLQQQKIKHFFKIKTSTLQIKMRQIPHNKQQSDWKYIKSFVSGGIAGIVSKSMIAPIQRIKYMYLTRSKIFTYRNFFSDFKYVIQKNGILNLWRGNSMNILKIFPHAAIDFAVFDFLRTKFYKHDHSFKQKIILFLCGASAGICSITVTTPIQFIRVRLAMEIQNFTYKNNIGAFKQVHKKEGFLGFYRGFGAALCGIVIYHGCSFFIFTKIKEWIKSNYPQSFSKWYVDFAVGAFCSIGQFMSYPFQILKRRMQGQALLFQNNQINETHQYCGLIKDILAKEGFFKGFYKGISLNFLKAPLALATVWTVKNYINRKWDENYDL